METGQYQIAVQQLECPIDDPPGPSSIEDLQEFRFDSLLKIGACPLGRTDRAKPLRNSLQFIPTKVAVAAGVAGGVFLRFVKDDEQLMPPSLGPSDIATHLFSAGKMVFQSCFMSTTVQFFALASSKAFSSLPMEDARS